MVGGGSESDVKDASETSGDRRGVGGWMVGLGGGRRGWRRGGSGCVSRCG